MATCLENQLLYNTAAPINEGVNYIRVGQRLTIPNRTLTEVSFWLKRTAVAFTPRYIRFEIKTIAGGQLWSRILTDDSNTIETSWTKYSLYGDNTLVNEEVRLYVWVDGNLGGAGTSIDVAYQNTDVKASESQTYWSSAWSEAGAETWDTAYEYAYDCAADFTPRVFYI